jgi:N-formylglutamate amidohydrolase
MKTTHIFCFIFFLILLNACKRDMPIVETQIPKDIVSKKRLDIYTEVQYGNMPLIISVPHGGVENPSTIPDRTCPNIVTSTDLKTIELANVIDSVCKVDYGFQPYLIINCLKRTKLDQNREIVEATCSNSSIENIWKNYHLSIDTCIAKITNKYPQVLFIDLHGHGHTKQRLELGYLVSGSELRNPSTIIPSNSSYYNMLQQNPFLSSNQFLTTPNSFGTFMANRNFPSVPSAQDVAPLITDEYFDGGYNTKTYTSSLYPKVYGWQMETNFTGVRDTETSKVNFAKAFLQSIMQFYTVNTSMKPTEFGK